jgi:hypothetical protein
VLGGVKLGGCLDLVEVDARRRHCAESGLWVRTGGMWEERRALAAAWRRWRAGEGDAMALWAGGWQQVWRRVHRSNGGLESYMVLGHQRAKWQFAGQMSRVLLVLCTVYVIGVGTTPSTKAWRGDDFEVTRLDPHITITQVFDAGIS